MWSQAERQQWFAAIRLAKLLIQGRSFARFCG